MCTEKAQNSLTFLQKYCSLVLYEAQIHKYFSMYIMIRQCQIMHNVYGDHIWQKSTEGYIAICQITSIMLHNFNKCMADTVWYHVMKQ